MSAGFIRFEITKTCVIAGKKYSFLFLSLHWSKHEDLKLLEQNQNV